MDYQYWTIKEVADMLGQTTQAIYKNKDFYLKNGYMVKAEGGYKINLTGYNYFLSKQKKETSGASGNNTNLDQNKIEASYMELLKNRVEQLEIELKEVKTSYENKLEEERGRTAYFQQLFETKDRQLMAYMLPSGSSEHLEEKEKKKKGFFSLFK